MAGMPNSYNTAQSFKDFVTTTYSPLSGNKWAPCNLKDFQFEINLNFFLVGLYILQRSTPSLIPP
jgi:hypothetical protein